MRSSLTIAELNTQIALEMRVREGAEKMLRALLGTKDKKARRQREEVPVITHVLPQLPLLGPPPPIQMLFVRHHPDGGRSKLPSALQMQRFKVCDGSCRSSMPRWSHAQSTLSIVSGGSSPSHTMVSP